MARIPTVAIACQGGGSHAAFAAGVLQRLLGPELRGRFRLLGLSGTSGGALCAALAWVGLQRSGPDEAVARLGAFWTDLQAREPLDALANQWNLAAARAPVTAELSPYWVRPLAEERLGELVARHIPLESVPAAQRERSPLKLLVGATDVLNGERVVFGNATVTGRHLIASAAVPPLFRAIAIDGRLYWDGLFTSNPPVREFTDGTLMGEKPDEIWVVQINPQRQASEPQSIRDIDDRRNELSGNLALAQELYFIEKINELTGLMAAHRRVAWPYARITVRVVEMPLAGLDYASKLDRSPALIERLLEAGRARAPEFFDAAPWPASGSIPRQSRRLP